MLTFKKILKKNQKNQKKSQSDMWQSQFMVINDLNIVIKKGPN